VTAAAGGTGQFAVQLAKLKGCTVIGTCSSEAKVKFLKSIGCDRAINYKTENLDQVLGKEFPNGFVRCTSSSDFILI
jgi:NADPH-dependent curcumin reductase CurA